jgi:hypothetical protein
VEALREAVDAGADLAGLNFTLSTKLGSLDLFGEILGGGTYEDLLPPSIVAEMFGVSCRILSLEALIGAKRAAGRPRDHETMAESSSLRHRLKRN